MPKYPKIRKSFWAKSPKIRKSLPLDWAFSSRFSRKIWGFTVCEAPNKSIILKVFLEDEFHAHLCVPAAANVDLCRLGVTVPLIFSDVNAVSVALQSGNSKRSDVA